MITPISATPANAVTLSRDNHTAVYDVAVELEAAFLAEMLKSAGLGQSRETLGGGAGEDHFGSFMVQAQAREMASAGGIGLAETLYHSLMQAEKNG